MEKLFTLLLCLTFWEFVLCQYQHVQGGYQGPSTTPANILLHKQALGTDGSFNYAFAADNGLQQGEVISPDGSRKGSYSYVDPNGKTVSLSYTAGKDGFRVLNGDHVPKAPEQHQPSLNSNHYQQQPIQRPPPLPQFSHHPQQQQPNYQVPFVPNPVPYEAYRNSPNAPVYRGNPIPYEAPIKHAHHAAPAPTHPQGLAPYRVPPPQVQTAYRHPAPPPAPILYQPPRQYSVQEGNYEKPSPYVNHHQQNGQEIQKPHSFGNGFAFEFAG